MIRRDRPIPLSVPAIAVLLATLSATLLTTAIVAQHEPPPPDSSSASGEQPVIARRQMSPGADASSYTVTAEDGVPEIPFRLVNNHLILPLRVNGSRPVDAVLDTGMPAPGIALYQGPRTAELELEFDPSMQVQVKGAGGEGAGIDAQMMLDVTLDLDGLRIEGSRLIALPPMEEFGGYHDALIGYSLFSRFVVELDYDRGVMRLLDPATYEVPAGAHVLPLELKHRLPYVTLEVTPAGGEPFEADVVVDLGASHAISLNADSHERIEVPARRIDAVLGRGLSGAIEGSVGRLAGLDLGGARLTDVIATFPVSEHQHPRGLDSRNGNLGSDVLRRFTTVFDYTHERMILVPNESFDEPFEWDHSGLRLAVGNQLAVESVQAGSPAAEAGIQIGDVLTGLDGTSVGPTDYGQIRQTLLGTGDVRLTLTRGEKLFETAVTLRRLI